jgi:hypothetical protein
MKHLLAFINGVREFRMTMTTHYAEHDVLETYDRGREFAHRATFRRFEV